MDQAQQLTHLIEKAIENWPGERRKLKWALYSAADNPANLSINDLLFGDNLSFLEALLPDRSITVAKLLVVDNDEDRIPCLYSEVFGGQDK